MDHEALTHSARNIIVSKFLKLLGNILTLQELQGNTKET